MTDLRRAIRLPHATALVVGTIIGASIFVQPSEITSAVPSVGGVLLVWALAGVLTLAGALVCAELASAFTRSGGVYVYLREAYHPALGFLWGWAMFWVTRGSSPPSRWFSPATWGTSSRWGAGASSWWRSA
jgi:APA family basic amino acid/polyamine antiporter